VSVKRRAIYHQWTEYSCSLRARFVGCSWHQFCDEHYITCYITCSVRLVCTGPFRNDRILRVVVNYAPGSLISGTNGQEVGGRSRIRKRAREPSRSWCLERNRDGNDPVLPTYLDQNSHLIAENFSYFPIQKTKIPKGITTFFIFLHK
jgi:hypothetical protein